MRPWDLVLPVERDDGSALFLQIARGITDHIRSGRLRPGDPIPGTRSLARSLGVHRNTVIAACRELAAEGWLTTHPARGTFVSRALPDPNPRPFAAPKTETSRNGSATSGAEPLPESRVPYPLRPAPPLWNPITGARPGSILLVGGKPDVSLVPVLSLARAYRRTLKRHGPEVLGYGNPRGHRRLRTAIAQMLGATRGLAVGPEQVLIARGSQMAMFVIGRTLFGPGDVVAVESLGYVPAWHSLRSNGARLVSVPVDENGIVVDALERLTKTEKVRGVYLTPHHHYPTTVTLSPGRRIQLLDLARRKKFVVIEDDYDHEFHFEGRPILPLASADEGGRVVYLGTLSKVLAPGLRIGYIIAPKPVVDRMSQHRTFVDINGDHALESAVAELFEEGEVQRHVRRARRVYMARRDALVHALRTHLGGRISFEVPNGGMAIWCRMEGKLDVDAWTERCAAAGVRFQAGRMFAFDGRTRPFVRLGFAPVREKEIDAAVKIMAAELER